jgi:hypothetical protein
MTDVSTPLDAPANEGPLATLRIGSSLDEAESARRRSGIAGPARALPLADVLVAASIE